MVTEFTLHNWKEWRRMQALHLMKQEGWKQRDIAVALDVTEGAGSRWLAAARREGAEALLSRPAPGPSPKLTPAQQRLIPDFLGHGEEAYGFRGELWSCARVVKVSRRSSASPTARAKCRVCSRHWGGPRRSL